MLYAVLSRLPHLALLVLFAAAPAAAQSPTPLGVWLDPSKRVHVEIEGCGEFLCGRILWFKWPDDAPHLPLLDIKNTDPDLRMRPLLGLTVLRDLRRTGESAWEGGRIYNPDDGVDYKARMWIQEDGTLRVRTYMLIPLFGKTQVWSRVR